MIKKEIFIGFFTGILSTVVGMILYVLIFSDISLYDTSKKH